MRCALLVLAILIPGATHAAVIISEVAWMGSLASANHEWIELHNTGSGSIDVSGWTLTDGMNLSIVLTGIIGAGDFAVLERSSDASAPGSAFLTYTGAMVNTGATLKLTRSDGGIEDQVAGGTDWKSIGGDNVTKETAQYTTSGWVTGAGTPGKSNSGTAVVEEEEEVEEETEEETDEEEETEEPLSSSSSNRSSSAGETVRLLVKDSTLVVAVDAQKVGYVNQDILFTAKPSSIARSLEGSLVYHWNFGDGTIGYGKEIGHEFLYPGTYVVTLYTSYKNQKQLSRHEITVLPVAMSLTRSRLGDIQINNDSPYEIDISGYAVEGSKSFVFPNYSVLLPNQTITLPAHKIGGAHAWIKDTLGEIVTAGFGAITSTAQGAKNEHPQVVRTSVPTVSSLAPSVSPPMVNNQFGFATTTPSFNIATTATLVAADVTATTTPTIPESGDKTWPYLGLIVIMTLGLIGTALKVTRNQNN
jgi:Lamin Tail Domain/PKD domain